MKAADLRKITDANASTASDIFFKTELLPKMKAAAKIGRNSVTFPAIFPISMNYLAVKKVLEANGYSVNYHQPHPCDINDRPTFTVSW